ncbi:MAG TPA: alpha/beta fold hydrolase [Planctomycetota bacterium]|nr:alpha/beta fold hydrolase [Planctomycetota bacterium]
MTNDQQLGYIKALDGSPLYCAYHPAAAVANPQSRLFPVVIAPPLFEERKSAYAPLRRLAVKLAAAGHAVMRFDYRGSGESGGDPAARRWEHLAEDVASVRKTLARLSGKRDSVLLGLRMGATLALQESIRAGGEGVVALAPLIKGAAQVRLWKMRSKIRAELTVAESGTQKSSTPAPAGIIDFDGYDVHPGFFDAIASIDLVKDLGRLSCPGLVMQLSHRAEPAPETEQLMATLGPRAKLECVRMEPFWDKLDDVDTAAVDEAVLRAVSSF